MELTISRVARGHVLVYLSMLKNTRANPCLFLTLMSEFFLTSNALPDQQIEEDSGTTAKEIKRILGRVWRTRGLRSVYAFSSHALS